MPKLPELLANVLQLVTPRQPVDTTPSLPTLTQTFRAPMDDLETRAVHFRKVARGFGYLSLFAAAVSLVSYATGWAFAPSEAVDMVQVPDHAARLFEPISSGGGELGSFATPAEAISGSLHAILSGAIFKVMGGAMLVFGLFQAFTRQNLIPFFASIPILAMPSVMGALLENTDPSLAEKNDSISRNVLLAAAEDSDYAALSSLLKGRAEVDDPTKVFILSQAAIASDTRAPEILSSAAKYLRSGEWPASQQGDKGTGGAFTVSPQLAYAIEMAADGKVRSSQAVGYQRDALETSGAWKSFGWAAWLGTNFFGLAALGPLLMSQVISQRLKRIRGLISLVE